MKRLAFVALVLAFLAVPALAQNQAVGILTGVTQSLEDGFDTNFPDNSFEVFYSAETDLGVDVRIKAGRVAAGGGDFIGIENSPGSVQIEYVGLSTDYRLWEPWGSSTISIGPGAYRVRHAGTEETQFGVSAAVGSNFPVSRRLGIVAEVEWHWVNADIKFSFININGGVRFAF